jgi:hypothetical protein
MPGGFSWGTVLAITAGVLLAGLLAGAVSRLA